MEESFEISIPQLQERLVQVFKFQPHQEQVEAIHHLLTRREDLILIAKTGWGKSLIFPSIPLLHPAKGICLMIMPLSLLEEDQARQINAIEGCAACVLNASTNSESLRNNIKHGFPSALAWSRAGSKAA
jgi:superfamily II DNA helicase RecQ